MAERPPAYGTKKGTELILELRLHRQPQAPLAVHFDLALRVAIGGPILASAMDVSPKLLHKVTYALLSNAKGKLYENVKVIGLLGDD